ncbi:MAG: hypothetical protein IH624_11400 [Phycisphaerae bacterium]|nr:hypothetical protein [Phycisphaerae bacterium]
MGYVLYVLIGAVVGGGCVWLIYDVKAKKIIDDLQKRLGIAEAENLRIGPLEQQLAESRAHISELQERTAELKDDIVRKTDTIAQLNVQLVEQAKAARSKLSMLNDVQGRFCQALATLSETALNCDNEEFVRVMEMNVTAFEETLLRDIETWQARDQAAAEEVCDVADSEQVEPLFAQDLTIEGLVALDGQTGKEPEDIITDEGITHVAGEVMLSAEAADLTQEATADAGSAAGGADDCAVVEELRVLLDSEDEDVRGPAGDEDTAVVSVDETDKKEEDDEENMDAAINDQTADAVADLERELDEELALEFEDSPDDDDLKLDIDEEERAAAATDERLPEELAEDMDEIRLLDEDDSEAAPSLKFPICELPANDAEATLANGAQAEACKKKLNSESGPSEERKEAV